MTHPVAQLRPNAWGLLRHGRERVRDGGRLVWPFFRASTRCPIRLGHPARSDRAGYFVAGRSTPLPRTRVRPLQRIRCAGLSVQRYWLSVGEDAHTAWTSGCSAGRGLRLVARCRLGTRSTGRDRPDGRWLSHPQLDLEPENVSNFGDPIEIRRRDLSSVLRLSLEDKEGRAVPPVHEGGGGVGTNPFWLELPLHSAMRITSIEEQRSSTTGRRQGKVHLRPFTGQSWDLTPKEAAGIFVRGTLGADPAE